jgi:hypothetical protein
MKAHMVKKLHGHGRELNLCQKPHVPSIVAQMVYVKVVLEV